MAEAEQTRIQLCGRLVVELAGRRVEDALPGGKGRMLFAYPCRPLLQGEDRPRLEEWRRLLQDIHLRGLECFAQARLGLGGPTLLQAEECARELIELAPYRETGHRILMEALEQRGNVAEALIAYDRLRVLLRDELGVDPSPAMQAVHQRLLHATTSATSE